MIAAVPLVASALSGVAPAAPVATAAAAPAGSDFLSVMSKVASDAVGNLKGAEAAAAQGLQGKADTQTVVGQVMSAQESLQTALAIRDKAVAAYQDVSRMSI